MKRAFLVLVVLLLLALLLSGLLGRSDPGGDRPPKTPETATAESADGGADLTPPDEAAPPAAPATGKTPAGTGADAPAAPSTEPAPPVESPAEPPPALKPNPRLPPEPKPSISPGRSSRPPMGPTGHWEKFAPARPSGPATLTVKVLDREGVPVPGADVYLGPPDAADRAPLSFGLLLKLGVTGPDGTLVAHSLPEGAADVAGNLAGLLNRRRGLDTATAVSVVLGADRPATTELRLPLALSSFGAIEGTVRDPGGNPLRSAQVFCGFCRVLTHADGAFRLTFVPAGTARISVSRNGYRPASLEVPVVAGETARSDVDLEYAESGTVTLSGTVTGPEGEPVPAATVYVIAKQGVGAGTVRSGITDEQGHFEMASLPDRLRETEVRLQANASGYRAGNVKFPDGFEGGQVDIVLPIRLVRLRLTVLDGRSGAPLDRCRFEARAEGEERPVGAFSSSSPTGVYETWLVPGELEFLVEAPDHEPLRATVSVGPAGAVFPWTARLVATGETAVEVALSMTLLDAATDAPVRKALIEVLPVDTDDPVSRFEGTRDDGRFQMPAPSGDWRIRVSATGYQAHEERVTLDAEPAEAKLTWRLVRE